MRKLIRRCIAVLLCVTALILVFIPSPESYASTERGDYLMNGSVIEKYKGNAERLTLPENITEIGKDAFSGCNSLVRVIIPEGVSKIGYSAFENCTSLEEVVIPKSVKAIDSGAFSGCTRLVSVSLPEKTRSLGSGVFAGCTALSNVPIASGNTEYVCSDGVIYSKNGKNLIQYLAGRPKTSYSMPSTIEKIGEYAFWGAGNLTDVKISSNVKTIPEYAFANCSGLSSVVLPYGVRSLMAYSFSDCNSLRNITIPDSVGYIDINAFASSKKVALDFEGGAVSDPASVDAGQDGGDVSSESTVSGNALEKTDDGEAVYHGDEPVTDRGPTTTAGPYSSVQDFAETRIVGGNALVMLSRRTPVKGVNMGDAETEDDVSESGAVSVSSDDYNLIEGIFSDYSGNDAVVNIPGETERIGNRAFYQDSYLEGVVIPDSVKEIGDFSFARSGISSVEIPPSVTDIGYAAFYECMTLSEVSIPSSVKNIELGAFEGTPFLNNWYHDPSQGDFLIVGDGILLAYKGNGGNISIPEGVKTIGPQCFFNNQTITGVYFPESVKKIGEEAFDGCKNLSGAKLPPNLKTIEDRAFMGTGISEVIIPATVRSIGTGAFDNTETTPLGAVVFLGNTIPAASAKSTASRLSAGSLRTPAFNGVKNAIISETADLSDDSSVLAPDRLGFRGAVYTITDSSKSPGNLKLVRALNVPDENGFVSIDPHVSAGGRSYVMSDVSDKAFDKYSEEYYYNGRLRWAGRALKDITIQGNSSEALEGLLAGIYKGGSPVENTENNAIKVLCRGDSFDSSAGASASIPGSTENYVLTVCDDESRRTVFEQAISREYKTGNFRLVPLDISLSSMMGNVNITKLGTSKLEICIPVPSALKGTSGIKAGALNDNLVFEPLAVSEIVVDNVACVRFVASHLSPFALFGISQPAMPSGRTGSILHVDSRGGAETTVSGTPVFAGNTVNGVIRTLNKQVGGGVSVKWFVIVILICSALILFLIRDGQRK